MEASRATQAEGSSEDTRRSLDGQNADLRQLKGLVGTLLALVDDFLFFSKASHST